MILKVLAVIAGIFGALMPNKVQCLKWLIEPHNETVLLGSELVLSCIVEGMIGNLQWVKDDAVLNEQKHSFPRARFTTISRKEMDYFWLNIKPVALTDEGNYQCEIIGPPGIRSRSGKVTVLAFPDPSEILQGDSIVTTEFQETELECVSRAGKPAAKITWFDNDKNVLKENVKTFIEPVSDGLRFTVRSVLKLIPQKNHNNDNFSCKAENAADTLFGRSGRFLWATIKLEVKYAPKVNVKILSGTIEPQGWIPEGGDVKFLCEAEAGNPADMSYKWFFGHKLIINISGNELIIRNVNWKNHCDRVVCVVNNTVGSSSSFKKLNVTYAPRFITSGHKIIEAELGAKETLTCDVNGNPRPIVQWIHNGKVVGKSANLTFTIDHDSDGSYYCSAYSKGFHETKAELVTIFIKNRPPIISHRIQFEDERETVALECVAVSMSYSTHIYWSFEGTDIDSSNENYSILENRFRYKINSTLLIHKPEQKHFGFYNCSATNSYGMNSVKILLERPGMFSPPQICKTAIAVGVSLVIMVGIISVGIILSKSCKKLIFKSIPI